MWTYIRTSRNPFFGGPADLRAFVCAHACADCGRERRKRIYPRRGKVGSTEPVTKVPRSVRILDVSGVPPRICGWLEFTASEQRAHDWTFTEEDGGRWGIRGKFIQREPREPRWASFSEARRQVGIDPFCLFTSHESPRAKDSPYIHKKFLPYFHFIIRPTNQTRSNVPDEARVFAAILPIERSSRHSVRLAFVWQCLDVISLAETRKTHAHHCARGSAMGEPGSKRYLRDIRWRKRTDRRQSAIRARREASMGFRAGDYAAIK